MAAHGRSDQERFRVFPGGGLDLLELGAAFVQIVIDEDAAIASERHGALFLLQVEGFHGASQCGAPGGAIRVDNAAKRKTPAAFDAGVSWCSDISCK